MANSPWVETNIRLLREQFPGLAERLLRKPPDASPVPVSSEPDAGALPAPEPLLVRVETAASGDPTLVVNGLHIHSPRDPVREGRRAAENPDEGISGKGPEASTGTVDGPVIVLGFGLGYAVEAAAERWPERPLVVVERRRELLLLAMETRDLGRLLAGGRLIFVLGDDPAVQPDIILGALRRAEKLSGSGTPALIRNRGLMNLDREWYAGVERHIRTWVSGRAVNRATLRRFGKRWVRNLSRNMEAIRDLPGVSHLAGILGPDAGTAGIPVLLAAAGPSLDDILPLLPALRERCVIVAVDTSLRLLLRAKTCPDFVVAVDPQFLNALHLDHCPAPETRLIAESAVYPSVLRHPFAGAFLCGSLFPLGRFIEDLVDIKGELGAGGSVATTAWDFARLLGPPAIHIAGLDLAYPELKTHFRGARFEERALAESDRLCPGETWLVRALRDGHQFRAPAADGGQVLTDRRLSLYAAWFENRFRLFPELPSRSLSRKGLAIPGLLPGSSGELLALPPRREEIDRRLAGLFARIVSGFADPAEQARRANRYEAARRTLREGLEYIRGLAGEAAGLAEKARQAKPGGTIPEGDPPDQEGILTKLDKVNRQIATSTVKDVAGFLFPPLEELEGTLTSPESDRHGRHLELSAKLYRALAEAASYTLEALGER
ncbi:MAG: DUF115 domain-containing protein [Spirochaetaceae bacterium]|jgi:hypothetical protein|nr:DUF115 domain-containing protein [Spirochaetaceae bacterium]